jgi:hypothetical protein
MTFQKNVFMWTLIWNFRVITPKESLSFRAFVTSMLGAAAMTHSAEAGLLCWTQKILGETVLA